MKMWNKKKIKTNIQFSTPLLRLQSASKKNLLVRLNFCLCYVSDTRNCLGLLHAISIRP